MPTRASPLFQVTPSDVKLIRPEKEEDQIEAWEALIALFFAASQIMRTCQQHEQINRSPYASYHQHALVTPDTLVLNPPERTTPIELDVNPPTAIHGFVDSHEEAEDVVQRWSETLNACNIREAATMSSMTYYCQLMPDSTKPRFVRLRNLDKTRCGLASTRIATTPVMDIIADVGIRESDLGTGCTLNQGMVAPFFQAYHDVQRSIIQRLNGKGPIAALKSTIPKDSSQWFLCHRQTSLKKWPLSPLPSREEKVQALSFQRFRSKLCT